MILVLKLRGGFTCVRFMVKLYNVSKCCMYYFDYLLLEIEIVCDIQGCLMSWDAKPNF